MTRLRGARRTTGGPYGGLCPTFHKLLAPLGTGNVVFGSSTGSALLGGFRFGAGTFAFRELRRVAGATTTQWGILADAGQVCTTPEPSAAMLTGFGLAASAHAGKLCVRASVGR